MKLDDHPLSLLKLMLLLFGTLLVGGGCVKKPPPYKPQTATLRVDNQTPVTLHFYLDGGDKGTIYGSTTRSFEVEAGEHTMEFGWGDARFLNQNLSLPAGATREVVIDMGILPARELHYTTFCTGINKNTTPWLPINPGTSFPSGTDLFCLMHWKFLHKNDHVETEWQSPSGWTDVDAIHLSSWRDLISMHTSVHAATRGTWTVTYRLNSQIVKTRTFTIY